jgi:hypothetical protein
MSKWHFLNHMGIKVWQPRPLRHTFFKNCSYHLSGTPVYHSLCLVLSENSEDNAETNKILKGMLSVLELPKEALCLLHCNLPALDTVATQPDWISLKQEVIQFLPQHVLLLGEKLAQGILQDSADLDELREKVASPSGHLNWHVSYDPHSLAQQPQNKGKAFRDLCRLRTALQQ